MLPQRLTLLTLASDDLARARAFHAALGWREVAGAPDGMALYRLGGLTLALFDRGALAADQGRPGAELGAGAATLAINLATEADVDAAFAAALAAGARPLKRPARADWGGWSGYYSDPDGHVWELAFNPVWPLAADGALTLPGGDAALDAPGPPA